MLSTLAVCLAQVRAREQMLVHAHGAVVLAATAKQVPQGKVQLGGVGVVLNSFNERINGLVLLLIEQVIQTLEVGTRRLQVVDAHLAQIQSGRQPAQAKSHRQGHQNPTQIQFHKKVLSAIRCRWGCPRDWIFQGLCRLWALLWRHAHRAPADADATTRATYPARQ